MKKIHVGLLGICLVCCVCFSGCKSQDNVMGGRTLDDTTFAPGSEKTINISSTKPLQIGFELIGQESLKFADECENKTCVELRSSNGRNSVKGLFGASLQFTPTNGAISIVAKNLSTRSLHVRIFSDDS